MLVLLAVVVVITAAASYFSVKAAYLEFQQQQQQLAQQLGDQLNRRLAVAWEQEGMTGVARVLQEFAPGNRSDIEMKWYWTDNPTGADEDFASGQRLWSEVRVGQLVSVITEDGEGNRELHTYVPIDLASGQKGRLELTGSLQPVERETRRLIRTALLTIGGLAITSIGVMYIAGVRWVGRPLDALIAKTQRIGRGDFTGPLTIPGHSEFSHLAAALNEMCDKLTDQQAQLAAEATQRLATLEQLRHADRLKTVGRLAAGLAHELGTPLNVVSGRAALIASGRLSPAEIQSSASTIKSEAERITEIVRQLLDFARRRQPRRASIDLRQVATRTSQLLEALAEKHHVRLALSLSPEPTVAAVDDGQLQQALANVLVNAIQAMPDGGTVSITLQAVRRAAPTDPQQAPADYVQVTVVDQGPGIPEAIREHIFEPFFTTKEVGEGTGLGLSIAYGLIQEHGGWIDASNNAEGGARFDIFVPQERET
jgi:signal transduction histidine kinase